VILQCKAWNTYQVGVKPVRELLGVMAHNGVSKGIFLATGAFTREAVEFASASPIELVTGQDFLAKINELPADFKDELLREATKGDYLTPSCPSCGIKMVKRSGSRGEFWGCQNYPRCRQRFARSARSGSE
jgi:restriction system protein